MITILSLGDNNVKEKVTRRYLLKQSEEDLPQGHCDRFRDPNSKILQWEIECSAIKTHWASRNVHSRSRVGSVD